MRRVNRVGTIQKGQILVLPAMYLEGVSLKGRGFARLKLEQVSNDLVNISTDDEILDSWGEDVDMPEKRVSCRIEVPMDMTICADERYLGLIGENYKGFCKIGVYRRSNENMPMNHSFQIEEKG